MRTIKHDTKKSWLQGTIRGWHAMFADLFHWGPLALREIVDDWCLAIGPDWRAGDGNRVANREPKKKLAHDTNDKVP